MREREIERVSEGDGCTTLLDRGIKLQGCSWCFFVNRPGTRMGIENENENEHEHGHGLEDDVEKNDDNLSGFCVQCAQL